MKEDYQLQLRLQNLLRLEDLIKAWKNSEKEEEFYSNYSAKSKNLLTLLIYSAIDNISTM